MKTEEPQFFLPSSIVAPIGQAIVKTLLELYMNAT